MRQRLTELGVDFLARQVPAEPDDRDDLEAASGGREIPTLVSAEGGSREVLSGEEQILRWLDRRFDERDDARRHRAKARVEVREFEEVAALIER